jgi:hypothetical protein
MALIKCTECGNEVSGKAQSCPKCGHPVILAPDMSQMSFRQPDAQSPASAEIVFSEPKIGSDEPPPFRHPATVSGGAEAHVTKKAPQSANVAAPKTTKTSTLVIVGSLAAVAAVGLFSYQATVKPSIVATESRVDESCTVVGLEYCLRVFCKFRNDGGKRGVALVSGAILDSRDARQIAAKTSSVTLEAGQTDIVTFNFPEAEMDDGIMNYRAICHAE